MKKYSKVWIHTNYSDKITKENKNNISVSKNKIKQNDEELKKLTQEIVALKTSLLDKILLDPDLLKEVNLAKRIKKQGYRRQLQLIRKMLRKRNTESIRNALNKIIGLPL